MRTNKLIVLKYLTVVIAFLLMGIFVTGCSDEAAPTDSYNENQSGVLSKNPVTHHVSAGGSDIVPPGTNANFSLVANMKADGSVSGQWQDSFGHGNGGFHATITCLSVINGNEAWVSGVITSGNAGVTDLTGFFVITRVKDNGKSGDQISFSFIDDPRSCLDQPDLPLFELTHGQVKVR